MYSEIFRKLKLYDSFYPGELEYITKADLDNKITGINQRDDVKPITDAAAAQQQSHRRCTDF